MDCAGLVDRLEAFVEGSLSADEQRAADAHLVTCSRCREVTSAMPTDLRFLGVESPPDLTESILARTSGSVCQRALMLLPGYVDGDLEAIDHDLIQSHVDHCPVCAAVARALTTLPTDIAVFAEAQPGSGFVEEVVSATASRRSPWSEAWGRWLRPLLGRSRIAWEAGYVGAIVLWALFGAAWAPLRAAPAQVLVVVQQNPVRELVTRLGESGVWAASGGRVVTSIRGLGSDVSNRSLQIHEVATVLKQRLVELRKAAVDLDAAEIYEVMKRLRHDLAQIWGQFWSVSRISDQPRVAES